VRGLRLRSSGGVVPVWVYAAAILGLAAAMLIVVIGDREQHHRRITGVTSASVEQVYGGLPARKPVGPVQVDPAEAARLARTLNTLPGFPSGEWNCGEESGGGFWVRFAVDNGSAVAVSIDNGGCLGVDARTDGQWWYWGKWDPDGRARAEIRKDLRTG
jgi:hypothetical protein